jgi:hypothetical protein
LLTFEARRGRDAVRDWLRMHHIPIEDAPRTDDRPDRAPCNEPSLSIL